MRVSEAFPSKYLGATDLGGKPAVVRISNVIMDMIDNERKMVISFVGKKKTMVCNKTNATKIADILQADDTDHWLDQVIELYTADVDFQGRSVEAIRVRAPRAAERTETRSPDRQEARRDPPPREREREPDRISSGIERGHDREVDDRPAPPPRRAAAHDMDDDIPF
jgi:hypothetical protein